MSIGMRLREERTRIGLNQANFAALAGASKRAQLKWEKDESAPTSTVLAAFAEAGADVLYILTGRRTGGHQDSEVAHIEERLVAIERDLLRPDKWRLDGEDDDDLEARLLYLRSKELRDLLKRGGGIATSNQLERAKRLLEIAGDPKELTLFRAVDRAQRDAKREEVKVQLAQWLANEALSEDALDQLTILAIEYNVPVRTLLELFLACQPNEASAKKR